MGGGGAARGRARGACPRRCAGGRPLGPAGGRGGGAHGAAGVSVLWGRGTRGGGREIRRSGPAWVGAAAAEGAGGRDGGVRPSQRGERDDMALERRLGGPRLTYGLDVHRRVHAQAVGARGYSMQWKAFCDRAKMDALDGVSEDAEATLASFHFQMEDGAARFEADAGDGWPPGAHHPVQVSHTLFFPQTPHPDLRALRSFPESHPPAALLIVWTPF